ncbi:PEPD, partial [Symbiodinium sp. KB8]
EPAVSKIPAFDKELYAENRQRLAAALREAAVPAGAVAVLQGSVTTTRNETGETVSVHDSHFLWAVGANESGFYVAINVDDGKATLFVPKLPESYGIWMGALKTPAEIAAAYGVEEGKYVTEMHAALKAASPSRVLLNVGLNTDSGLTSEAASWEGREDFVAAGLVDVETLYPVLCECRVFKTEREIAVMRQIVGAASDAHCVMMRAVREGMREDGLEAVFKFWLQSTVGSRYNAYTYICGSGPNAAVLHYGHEGAPNDRFIGKDEFVLCDCGHELFGYASDITTAFPSSGKFTPDQRVVYSAVLGKSSPNGGGGALEAVEAELKPGVNYIDMQALAYRNILTTLKEAGVVTGEIEDMMAANLGAVFMPHGLGHMLGIDTHDVGGYGGKDARPRDTRDGFKSVRATRPIAKGMVMTVEPGCYFIDMVLDKAFANPEQAKFLVKDVIDSRFRGIGGVRLEDNIIITETGIDNMVYVPRAIDEVEAMCRGEITSRAGFAKRYQA